MKKIFLALAILFSSVFLSSGIVLAQAAPPVDGNTAAVCEGVGIAGGGSGCTESGLTVSKVIANVVNILSFAVGVVAVIMIIIAGFRFVTANGDAGNVTAARNTVLYAIVGLVVAALAQVIVKFVLNKVAK